MTQYKIESGRADETAVSERVISAVADARDKSALELPPLYDVVDADALDALFASGRKSDQGGPGRVVFVFDGCEVVVYSDGDVDVTAPADRS